jgi:hypothetical protein
MEGFLYRDYGINLLKVLTNLENLVFRLPTNKISVII